MIKSEDIMVVTGCGGMLGEAVYNLFKDKCVVHATDIDLNEPWLEHLDVTSKKEIKKYFSKVKPDYILHLAALTDMEYCELNPEHAFDVNARGVENILAFAKDFNIPFLYICTAGIFDGEKEEYHEHDMPNPLSVYGKSKYQGEIIARDYPKSIIIRAGWMMGGGPKKDKKFINKIVKQIRAGAKEIAVVNDKLGTPCYTYDLARLMEYLLNHRIYGLFHGVCNGGCSRFHVADHLLKELALDCRVAISQVDSNHFHESYFAPRPRSERLVSLKLKEMKVNIARDWQVCLSEYLRKFNWNLWDFNTSGMERNFYKNYFEIERNHWLMVGRRKIILDILKRDIAKPIELTRILDFGCGSGFFISELSKIGYEAYGLDISAEAIQFGKRQGIDNLLVMDSHKIDYPDNYFDCVLLMDVIEHFEDESWALKEVERVLAPNGIAIVMTPAYKFLWGVQDEVSHHYRRYTMLELTRKIKDSTDLRILDKTYFNTLLFLPIAIIRLISRLFGIKKRVSDFDINNAFLNKTMSAIFTLERSLMKRVKFPFGVSILMILKNGDNQVC